MERKKILLCITKSSWGGAQKYVFDLATNLPKDKFDISVLAGKGGKLLEELNKSGIKTLLSENAQRNTHLKKDFFLLLELIKIFRREKPNLVHLNSSKIGFVGALVVWYLNWFGLKPNKFKIKVVFTVHGWAFNEDRNFLSKIFLRIFQEITVILCDKTIAVAEKVKKDIPCILAKRKIIIIRNGIKESTIKEKDEAKNILLAILKEKGVILPQEIPLIGTISELHKNKGLKYAIEAVSKLEEKVAFLIIGEGEERNTLEKLIKDLDCENKVLLLGRIDFASIYLKAFDIFTLTSITEALPYVLLEAGKAEMPIVASDVGGIPEIIENMHSGILVRPKNPKEISGALKYLIENRPKAKEFGVNLKENIHKNFNLDKMMEETIKTYNKLV